ncbi:mycothiol transferase [Rhodococcoides kroppenstedtii]|uniref:mycothiol transferase n=1 Tax=Rhodococcoides kroppenstedtii TaxID=293050 RepID=UPI00362F1A53
MADTTDLLTYLQRGRDAVLWKLDGATEHDIRRPLTRTGTNLLGLVKHLAAVESGYLGLVFDRPFPEPISWAGADVEANADMWATPDQSRAGTRRRLGRDERRQLEPPRRRPRLVGRLPRAGGRGGGEVSVTSVGSSCAGSRHPHRLQPARLTGT